MRNAETEYDSHPITGRTVLQIIVMTQRNVLLRDTWCDRRLEAERVLRGRCKNVLRKREEAEMSAIFVRQLT